MTIPATAAPFDRAAMRRRLQAAWCRSDLLFDLLRPEALYERPIALRQPFIFYLGHLPAFGWNQVLGGLLGRESPEPELDQLFARGIDPVGVDRYEPDRPDAWPSPLHTVAYRDRVRAALLDAVADVAAMGGSDVLADHGRVLHLVLEHELMHHETLLYMMHELRPGLVRRPSFVPDYRFDGAASPARLAVPGGRVTLGAAFERVPFGWDNEFPETPQEVHAFQMDRTPVRNGEWLAFMRSGGYERPELWTAEGWAWKERTGHRNPVAWRRTGTAWRYQTVFDDFPLDQVRDWPVYVSWAEADAYTRWAGGQLPSEAEFHRAAQGVHWGDPAAGNYDFRQWAPVPVGGCAEGESLFGVRDLVGNGWEWTRSVFAPFPGFTAWARTYPGYSADFFDGQHYVILGASWATDRALVRRSLRNWFQPHYPYVFAKFRCVYR